MTNYKLQLSFFTALLVAVFILSFFVVKPYLAVLFAAVILRVAFGSLHEKTLYLAGNRPNVGALLSLLAVLVFIILPVALLGFLLFDDVSALYYKIAAGNFDSGFIERFTAPLYVFIGRFIPGFSFDIPGHVHNALGLILDNIGSIFSGLVGVTFEFFLMLLALFYLFRDGQSFKKYIIFLSPLKNIYDENILSRLSLAIMSVLKGSLLIACLQGVLIGSGFFIFGVPNPVLWGAIAAIAALIPSFGTALVLLPGVVFLFWSGMVPAAVALMAWGVVTGFVDNLLAPHLLTRGLKVHPLFILLSVLGGLWFFGPIGFLAGPVLVTLLIVLLDMSPAIIAGGSLSGK